MHLLWCKLWVRQSKLSSHCISRPGAGGRLHGCSHQVWPEIRFRWRNLAAGGQSSCTAVIWWWAAARPSTRACSAANTSIEPKSRPLFMYMSQVRHFWASFPLFYFLSLFLCCCFLLSPSITLSWAELPATPSSLLFVISGLTGCSWPIIS